MKITPKMLYGIMTVGGLIGIVAAFIQLVDTIALIENKDVVLACNINSVFSCSTVLTAWQSNVFGFPNSILCLALFMIFTTAGIAGLTGSNLSRVFRLGVQGISIFTLLFALWVLLQATYSIGALCILCIFCFIGLLGINWAWLRLNVSELPFSKKAKKFIQNGIEKNYDVLFWVTIGVVMAFLMIQRFI